MRAPLLQRPTYLDGAPADQALPAIKEAASGACEAARNTPGAGLVGATLLGVTAAYFAPKFFDWALARWRGHDQADEYDLEVE